MLSNQGLRALFREAFLERRVSGAGRSGYRVSSLIITERS